MSILRLVCLTASLLVAAPTAFAQYTPGGRASGIGIGAEGFVTGADDTPTAATVVYDRPSWHIAGLLAMESQGDTDLFIGGRFFYHLHQGAMSDFSLGGGLGILSLGGNNGPGNNNDRTDILLEAGAQLRAFVTSNVAIGASVGLGFVIVDQDNGDDYLALGGQVLSSAGIWYFFQ